MKKSDQINPSFKFWFENKINDERSYFISDIAQQFEKWLKKKDRAWIEYYGYEQVIPFFIGDKDGLNSVCDMRDLPEIIRRLKRFYKQHLGLEDVHKYLKS